MEQFRAEEKAFLASTFDQGENFQTENSLWNRFFHREVSDLSFLAEVQGVCITNKFDEEKVGTDCNSERAFSILECNWEVNGVKRNLQLGGKILDSQYDKSCFEKYFCW